MVTLRGLTLLRPWAAAIVQGPKRCENRSWATERAFPPGSVIAIHAGKGWDATAVPFIQERWASFDPRAAAHAAGVILGLAELRGYQRIQREPTQEDPWACGPVVWRLGHVVPLLTPIPCRGAYGLWVVPMDIERQLRAAWSSAA